MDNGLRIVIGLAGLIGAGWSALRVVRTRRRGRPADAVVTESKLVHRAGAQGARSSRWVSTVHYEDDDGAERVSALPGKYQVGETVQVVYLPEHSAEVSRRGGGSFNEAFAVLGVTAAAIALTLLM
ncbi:DUF3592 domain-containing protein [Jiangella gansuensis]|uniref:DUF3592 domain-containing protein n=1 Tax=Jiangella gansuensis TaxID=281473 RepID=UPI00047D90EB|nr:DUF3592 domain-containing protein [Jiangella gansuensis]